MIRTDQESPRVDAAIADSQSGLKEGPDSTLERTALANAEAREALARLADEQAALRRVATLVAKEDLPEKVFARVTEETGRLLGGVECTLLRSERDGAATNVGTWGEKISAVFPLETRFFPEGDGVAATVLRTGRPHRIDDYSAVTDPIARSARDRGIESSVGCPVVVHGAIWGAIVVGTTGVAPFAPETEMRLTQFADLVATAVTNAEARGETARLAGEQAALRRVATLVAEGAAPSELFTAVAREVGQMFAFAAVTLNRYEEDAVVVVADPLDSGFPVGSRWAFDGDSLAVRVHETRRMARIDDYSDIESSAAVRMRERKSRSAIGVPIFVEGELWGLLCVGAAASELLPADTGDRIAGFVELVGTAVANGQARDGLRLLAEEQAALRRVATLVARAAPPGEVFAAVAMEVGKLLDTDITVVGRYDGDGAATAIGSWSASPGGVPVGTRSPLGGRNVLTLVAETGKPARVEGYDDASGEAAEIARRHGWRSSIAAPIIVESRLWGVMLVATQRAEPFPAAAEERLAAFTDLVATALANAQAHDEVRRFAAEQATLRRVATLIALGVQPEELFAAVAEETAATFDAITGVMRFEHAPPGVTLVGVSKETGLPIGTRWDLTEGMASAEVYRTGRSARISSDADYWRSRTEPVAEAVLRLGIVSQVSCPIVVEGGVWGVITVNGGEELPADTEERLEKFTDLVTTAIANAESKSELAASRRRIVTAADDARRRIERDLHDGIQQRLIALSFRARSMERKPPDELPGIVAELAEGLKDVSDELREVSRGIHPTILTEAGLGPALRALARRSNVPVDVDVNLDSRLPDPVEAAAYYIASEALTNVEKHAHANVVRLIASSADGVVTLEVRDDGIGGVDAGRGSGILGLTDRAEALGGTISITSPARGGTTLSVRLPITS